MGSRRKTTPPPMSPWTNAFTSVDEASNPYWKYVPVQKSDVNGLPPGFSLSTDWGITKLYREDVARDPYTIRDLGPLYYVGREAYHPEVYAEKHLEHDRPRVVIIGGLAAAGTILGAKAASELISPSSEETTTTSPPRLAYAARQLDDKQYNIFVSHSWSYDEHYERIVDFLDAVPSLAWQNHSIPSTDPLDVVTDEALTRELQNQMRTASVMVVSAGMYGAYSKWIPRELELAEEMGKPVIAIVPEDQDRIPAQVQKTAVEIVGWRRASLVDALATHG